MDLLAKGKMGETRAPMYNFIVSHGEDSIGIQKWCYVASRQDVCSHLGCVLGGAEQQTQLHCAIMKMQQGALHHCGMR